MCSIFRCSVKAGTALAADSGPVVGSDRLRVTAKRCYLIKQTRDIVRTYAKVNRLLHTFMRKVIGHRQELKQSALSEALADQVHASSLIERLSLNQWCTSDVALGFGLPSAHPVPPRCNADRYVCGGCQGSQGAAGRESLDTPRDAARGVSNDVYTH
jgi:hypothetical protein